MDGPALDPAVIETLRQLTEPGEPDVLAEVLNIFLAERPRRHAEIDDAFAAGDLTRLHRAAHSLKGSAGNIGARALFAATRDLDEAARTGDAARLSTLVETVHTE